MGAEELDARTIMPRGSQKEEQNMEIGLIPTVILQFTNEDLNPREIKSSFQGWLQLVMLDRVLIGKEMDILHEQ